LEHKFNKYWVNCKYFSFEISPKMQFFGLIHSFSGVFRMLKTRIFPKIKMPFFIQISKVQYFISTVKPIF